MKKISFLFVLLISTPSWADWGDPVLEDKAITGKLQVSGGRIEIPNSPSLPPTCAIGEIYMDTSALDEQKCFLCEAVDTWVLQGPGGFDPPIELVISGGVITITAQADNLWRFHSIDTEGNAASDDLTSISGGNIGEIILLQAENSARTVVCKDSINLKLQGDLSLDNVEDKLMLICISANLWHEISRATN